MVRSTEYSSNMKSKIKINNRKDPISKNITKTIDLSKLTTCFTGRKGVFYNISISFLKQLFCRILNT